MHMLTILSILTVHLLAGSALYDFIRPVSKARYEQIVRMTVDPLDTSDKRGKFR